MWTRVAGSWWWVAVLTALLLPLIPLPAADATSGIDGDVVVSASSGPGGTVTVSFSVRNIGDASDVFVSSLSMPAVTATSPADLACRAQIGGSTTTLAVAPDGIVTVPGPLSLPAGIELLIECRFTLGPLCDLTTSITTVWGNPAAPDLTIERLAEPISPPCTAPTAAPTTSPTTAPTTSPTAAPSPSPTTAPTTSPTAAPTTSPTAAPTTSPTVAPGTAVDGTITITADANPDGTVDVTWRVENLGPMANVVLDDVSLPALVADSAMCRLEAGASTTPLPVATDGTLAPATVFTMPAASSLEITCRFQRGALCGLSANGAATWTALDSSSSVSRSASAPVTPPCPTTTVAPTTTPTASITPTSTPTTTAPPTSTPTTTAPPVDGEVLDPDLTIVATPSGSTVRVDFVFTNRGDRAQLTFGGVALPSEVADSAACRAVNGATSQPVAVLDDGSLGLVGTVMMQAGSSLIIECQFDRGDACDLEAHASGTWRLQSGASAERTASAPVTPPCTTLADSAPGPYALVTKEPSVPSAPVGTVVEWTITAHNIGGSRLNRVTITDELHPALELIERSLPSTATYDPATRTVTLEVGRLAPGEQATLVFATRLRALSMIPNSAVFTSSQYSTRVEGSVFGTAPVATPTPTAEPTRERNGRRDESTNRRPNRPRSLAYTGNDTAALAVIGTALIAAGALVTNAARRDD